MEEPAGPWPIDLDKMSAAELFYRMLSRVDDEQVRERWEERRRTMWATPGLRAQLFLEMGDDLPRWDWHR